MSNPIQITVGGSGQYDPVVGATAYVNPELSGIDFYVSKSGYGTLPYTGYDNNPAGGFDLLNGQQFGADEVYFVYPTGIQVVSANTGYSNGFNLSRVLNALLGRLGWSETSGLNVLNTTSNSGRRFDDGSFHSAVSVDNIKAVVASGNDVDAYFMNKQKAVIAKALQSVFSETEYHEQCFLYDRYQSELEKTIANSGKAIGYRICLAKKFDLAVQINTLQLYFNEVATFNVYLFKHGKRTPIKTKSVTTIANEKTEVSLTDWILSYRESSVYYVLYMQADLGSAQAIQEQAQDVETCMFDADAISCYTTGIEFNRINISETLLPQGLNMQVSSFRDFTQNILNQAHLFDELIGLTMAYQVLEDILYSTESSARERVLKGQISEAGLQLDLKGAAPISEGPKTKGLQQRIEAEIARVKRSFYPKPKSMVVNYECD